MTEEQNNNQIKNAALLIAHAQYMVAFTGAGISTPSGIRDFRSPVTGLWEQDNPMRVASATALRHNPQRFYNWLRPLMRSSQQALPNAAHLALARLEKMGKLRALITQNIDELHQRGGSKNVVELHGSMQRFYCTVCKEKILDNRQVIKTILAESIPTCVYCGGIVRPDITLFEETLPEIAWQRAEREIANADLLLVAGSSLEVYPASLLPHKAYSNKCKIIVVNYTSTYIDTYADVVLHEDVAKGLPQIVERLKDFQV